MIGNVYSSRPRPDELEHLKLSDAESFRLFGEGLLNLSQYEQRADRDALESAEMYLRECSDKYPNDVLPRFYLGVVNTYLGGMNQEDAIDCFRNVLATEDDVLRLAASYNLAVAYIQQQTPQGFDQAQAVLKQTISQLQRASENLYASELLFQTWVDLLFVRVRQTLWINRRNTNRAQELQLEANGLQKELDEFESELNDPVNRPFITDQIWADYFNVRGLLLESRAWFSKHLSDNRGETDYATSAVNIFKKSMERRQSYAAPKANLARVYYDFAWMNKQDVAAALWGELVKGVEEVEYSHYGLGRYFAEVRADFETALHHLRLAPSIPEAWLLQGTVFRDHLNQPEQARAAWLKIVEKFPEFKRLKQVHELLKTLPPPAATH